MKIIQLLGLFTAITAYLISGHENSWIDSLVEQQYNRQGGILTKLRVLLLSPIVHHLDHDVMREGVRLHAATMDLLHEMANLEDRIVAIDATIEEQPSRAVVDELKSQKTEAQNTLKHLGEHLDAGDASYDVWRSNVALSYKDSASSHRSYRRFTDNSRKSPERQVSPTVHLRSDYDQLRIDQVEHRLSALDAKSIYGGQKVDSIYGIKENPIVKPSVRTVERPSLPKDQSKGIPSGGTIARLPTTYELLSRELQEQGLTLVRTRGDGNCMFRSLADQLYGSAEHYKQVRAEICEYMEEHGGDFANFLVDESVDTHIARMRKDTTYGDNVELVAASKLYNVDISVYQLGLGHRDISFNSGTGAQETLRVAYQSEEEHYSSVRERDMSQQ